MECQIAEHLGRGFGYDIATYSAQRLDAFQLIAKERQEDIALQDDSYGHPLLCSHARVHSCSVEHIVAMTCIGWCLCAFLSLVMAVSLHDLAELRRGPTGQNKMRLSNEMVLSQQPKDLSCRHVNTRTIRRCEG